MGNITIKKDPNNRGHNELFEQLRSIWLLGSSQRQLLAFCQNMKRQHLLPVHHRWGIHVYSEKQDEPRARTGGRWIVRLAIAKRR